MELSEKLAILADAAKYDASCASSGTESRHALADKSLGSTGGMGICHSYTPDGRCISLLKLLLTNFCLYECSYCVNRASSQVPRAAFSVDEVVNLTLDFYKRNYIEGLFLSSGIIQSADYTMDKVMQVAKKLRLEHGFKGYIHLKTIPEASPELLAEAGLYADRLSINIELPADTSLKQLAPEKSVLRIEGAMSHLKDTIDGHKLERKSERKRYGKVKTPLFSPAGQSTQMIIGADTSNDHIILQKADQLYRQYRMRRVYYSAFSPIPDASAALPPTAPPLLREHRLYQADWLLRFYSFSIDEVTSSHANGMLDLSVDPKLAWALSHREHFPVDLNRADYEHILRVPGIGVATAKRLIRMRRQQRLRWQDLCRLRIDRKKVQQFVCVADHSPLSLGESSEQLKQRFVKPAEQQIALF